jgi:hypothetical protein
MHPSDAARTRSAAQLLGVEEAALSLHVDAQTFEEVIGQLGRHVTELGLAEEAVFMPASALGPLGQDEGTTRCADGTFQAEVRRPDGVLVGALRCTETSEQASYHVVVLAAHAGVALGGIAQVEALGRREAAVRRIAERLQDSLLPEVPHIAGMNVAVDYRPAARDVKVGGDFYDLFPLPDGRVMIVVGDVVGKGVEAAVHTTAITQTLRALALQNLPLDVLLDRADEQVVYQDPEIMATLWCGLYEPVTGELAFASLGHPPALLLRSTGEPIRLEIAGLPLGMRDLSPEPPEIRTRQIESRDLLVLYTDGVVEASRDFLAGQEELLRAIVQRRAEPLEQMLQGALDELLADANHSDDAVMVLLRRR